MMKTQKRNLAVVALALSTTLTGLASAQVVETSFQNGINGYEGTVDIQISERADDEIVLNTVASWFLDGLNSGGSSPDRQILIRFDDIIGNGDGQIPPGATILSAELITTTSVRGNAQTNGPWGVCGLLQAFNESTSYFVDFTTTTDMGSRGAWWMDGYSTRPTGGWGFQIPGGIRAANVTSLVQAWADGAENHGMAIQAGLSDTIGTQANTSDGWAIRTTGNPMAESRPKLSVTYTTATVQKNSFQEGTDGYNGTTMAMLRSGKNALVADTDNLEVPEMTEDGSILDQTFLDGLQYADNTGATDSPEDGVLIKFANVFGTNPGQASVDVPVAKAWLVLTTGDQSTAAHTSGPFAAHTMLRDWDLTSLHSTFGDNGLQVSEGDISPALDTKYGFIRGAEVWFDVTSYVEGVRNGATDNGIAVKDAGTADGWQIHATGSTVQDARPRLVVYSAAL